jgi:hypothetical protein
MGQLHMDGTKITASIKGGILYGYLDNCCTHWGILLSLLCCLVLDEVIEGLQGNGCFKQRYVLSSSAENSQSFTAAIGGFEYGTTEVR